MKKIEGTYVYQCCECSTLFAVVARLSVAEDKRGSLTCPKCLTSSGLIGEGHVTYQIHTMDTIKEQTEPDEYPPVLEAKHISEILGISKQVVYELMKDPTFPVIKINRFKRVNRDVFFKWLDDQSRNE